MEYLLLKLAPYLLLALGIGLFVGWYSCSRREE